jgi:hypothetical protein
MGGGLATTPDDPESRYDDGGDDDDDGSEPTTMATTMTMTATTTTIDTTSMQASAWLAGLARHDIFMCIAHQAWMYAAREHVRVPSARLWNACWLHCDSHSGCVHTCRLSSARR